ncbi:hydantoinase/oxoprolinase family protein [Desulfoscipio gibsoniae]|uniref:N-methylhydantoinase A/acetone carboxylase, beta subunit n=1 Tax=Desulfoscipio gibsoniae DSM 7213 TaxID=767817 RepID=R4KHX1_9FIRM|nr:hydantoinase/oxoprolinase family protein [Desulfoscipio gibsoniae]AGL02209.1 N-methylhydantoinase A/acetone carboxylase, beta subunit [Desulfoscipio gibsoniae DSM 7213]
MAKYVCIDIGGTFTDASILDENGDINVFKSLTTHDNYLDGMIDVLNVAAEYYNETLEEFLHSCSPFNDGSLTHGSTIATNAVLERKVAKVGMICTKGFRDVLLFRDGPIKNPFDFQLDYPEPYIPRYRILPVTERINSEGKIDIPLDENEVRQVIEQFKKWNVQAIAICLLWSVVNPIHEDRIRDIILEEWPEVNIVRSSVVNPCIREYRRWVSAAMDASLSPLISKYTMEINQKFKKLGLQGEVGMLNSSGGIVTADELVYRPLYAIDSGPAMAPVTGKTYVESDLAEENIVVFDMGGTSFDVSCIIEGVISVSRETKIGDEVPGISRIDVNSIGSGGGSIAWVDPGGMIRVGPHSAGSAPGPACYDKGGIYPTVTDANVVLGYMEADYFNAGRMCLNPELAEKAIYEYIAKPLGLDLNEAAFTVWSTVNANMITAIKEITIQQGIDPREFVAVAGGGACGVHAIPLAEGLNMKKILIPKTAGALSAVGGIFSDVVSEFSKSFYTETRDFDFQGVNEVIKSLYAEAIEFFDRNNILEGKRVLEFYVEGRYPYQVWEIPVALDSDVFNEYGELDQEGINKLVEKFHEEHEMVFAVKEPEAYVECIFWRVKAIGKRTVVAELKENTKQRERPARDALKGTKKAYFRDLGGMVDTNVYLGQELRYGNKIEGPAIIVEPTTTIIIYPGYELLVTKLNNYFIS